MKIDFELSAAIKGKYEVISTHCPVLHCRIGVVDFRDITEDQAEALIKAGTEYLRKVPAKKTPVDK